MIYTTVADSVRNCAESQLDLYNVAYTTSLKYTSALWWFKMFRVLFNIDVYILETIVDEQPGINITAIVWIVKRSPTSFITSFRLSDYIPAFDGFEKGN